MYIFNQINFYYLYLLLPYLFIFLCRYWLFRSWGRIGTTIGGCKTEEKDSLDDAKTSFELCYEDQTGNMWKNRNNFVKVPGKKVPVDTDYGEVILINFFNGFFISIIYL